MIRARAATAAGLLLAWGCSRPDPERVRREPLAELPTPASVRSSEAATRTAADSTARPPSAVAACNSVCVAATQLKCKKSASCVSSCLAMASVSECSEQLGGFFKCLGAQAVDHWECLEDGTGAIREGFCEAEQAAFAACLESIQH